MSEKQKKYQNKGITTEEINNIPYEALLRYLKIDYSKKGDVLSLYEGNEATSGWKIKISENFANDFAHMGRPMGKPFNFVKELLIKGDKFESLSDVFKLFEDFKKGMKDFQAVLLDVSERNIINEEAEKERKKNINEFIGIYNDLDSDEEYLKEYLKSRSIDINKIPNEVKNDLKAGTIFHDSIWYKEKMFIPMKDVEINESGDVKEIKTVGIKARAIGDITNKKFKSISIKNSYIGFYFIDELIKSENNKSLFICEGETDGLSLFSGGFKNVAWNLGGVGYVNPKMNDVFKKYKNIIIAYDNDDINKVTGKRPGEEGIKKMVETIGFDSNYYFINYQKIKNELKLKYNIDTDVKMDINDVLKHCGGDPKKFREIFVKGFEKFNKSDLLKEIKERDKNKTKFNNFKK